MKMQPLMVRRLVAKQVLQAAQRLRSSSGNLTRTERSRDPERQAADRIRIRSDPRRTTSISSTSKSGRARSDAGREVIPAVVGRPYELNSRNGPPAARFGLSWR